MSASNKAPRHPLAEVFGHPFDDFSADAKRHRKNRLCPYNNKVPSCTKDKANNPLGVCTIFDGQDGGLAVTCPVRFRQDWRIVEDAASFFFPESAAWTTLSEVRLNDANGKSAGNIDIVLVSYDQDGQVIDFGALEIQAVYISGNMRRPFERYIADPAKYRSMDWSNELHYPRPDYLSSSRKRLLPQLIYKGRILQTWKKKTAVAIHSAFYETLPQLPEVPAEQAEIAWLIYDLQYDSEISRYELRKNKTLYTPFDSALKTITTSNAGPVVGFIQMLQQKLDEQLDNTAPNTPILLDRSEE